ncbi:hypothetical protein OE88DRAFT_1653737 [Heliocybe sulcata]|uniref:Uncharacterized protein n=1 Tax=Heliocybe sulcata TaxID=5364 RepID=A0A5C3NCN1_9AGAM|nr:hypothetical protein OE88DRAFT_1653737 [Heliocybe sulcata]
MSQGHSTPLQSLLGGLGLVPPVHGLLVLNGDVFGISGFLHRAARGAFEPALGVLGLVLGGVVVGALDGTGPTALRDTSLTRIVISGLLVGVGTKFANGCTSGHMICGISRFSSRSLAATATFCTTGILTARFAHVKSLLPQGSMDWNLSPSATPLIALQAVPLAIESALYYHTHHATENKETPPSRSLLRSLALISSAFDFALALRVSNLTDPVKVVSFLVLPFHGSFDPSMAFLALGALPLMTILYHHTRHDERPRLGGAWSIPKGGSVDLRLLFGAAVFGVGWGMEGICPGPGLVNLGRAIATGRNLELTAAWLGSVIVGGLIC